MLPAAVSWHGGSFWPCHETPVQRWQCSPRPGNEPRTVRRPPSIRRRVMLPSSEEQSQPALLLSAIGADQKHCPVVLDAAASTSGGMLSLSVDVDERGASASSSWSRALVLAGGATAVQQDHMRSLAARQPSVRPSRQARAVQVHHRGDAVWPGLTPGRPARCARADPGRPTVAPSRHGVPPGLGRLLGARGAPGKRRH